MTSSRAPGQPGTPGPALPRREGTGTGAGKAERSRNRVVLDPADLCPLGTVTASGCPLVVPLVVVVADVLWSAVDAKPKSTRRLARLTNITGNPAVSVLVDHYQEDWSALWWVRADGTAEVMDAVSGEDALAVGALAAKYPQYATDPSQGPFIRVRLQRWSSWAAG
ncbi:MAG: TIGR03668 family PPOX class F420-dependent oxidoreductase [Dermatophilaceae bacterium]